MEKHYCYIVEAHKYVKIGYTKNLENRIDTMQTGNPHPIKLVCKFVYDTESAARAMEAHLHRRFRRARFNREWFKKNKVIWGLRQQGKFTEYDKTRLTGSEMDELEIVSAAREAIG